MISYGGEGEKDLKRKWLESLTLLLQMILFWIIAKPMRYFGLVFEWFLNLPNSNRNWRELSRDLLSGNYNIYTLESAFVGFLNEVSKFLLTPFVFIY